MRFLIGSLLLLFSVSLDDLTTSKPVATHVESIGYPNVARDAQIQGAVNELASQDDLNGAWPELWKYSRQPFPYWIMEG